MANKPIGNNFIEGPLGVVVLKFDGVDLGKTVDEASIEFVEDMKEIKYAQTGTSPYDKIPTGQAYKLTCKLGQLSWDKLAKLMRGVTNPGGGNSALLGRDIYRSGRDNFAKVLEVFRVDSDGVASTDKRYKLTFFLALPTVNGALGAFGPDTQRSSDVVFDIFFDESAGHMCYGYSGFASSLGIS